MKFLADECCDTVLVSALRDDGHDVLYAGAICLSANEWKKAGHFGDRFWLYVIAGAATDVPQLQRIWDLASQFQVGEDILSTGFIVPEGNYSPCARSG